MQGDYGNDTFIFQSYNDSSLSTEVDTIMDFETGRDKIELRDMGFDRDILHNGELTIEHIIGTPLMLVIMMSFISSLMGLSG